MDGRKSAGHSQSRPYRSKRHRPCDVCRRRKHACHLEDQPPCRVCRELGTDCTFNEPPSKRRRQSQLRPSVSPHNLSRQNIRNTQSENGDPRAVDQGWDLRTQETAADGVHDAADSVAGADPFAPLGDSISVEMLQPSRHDDWVAAMMMDTELGPLSLAFMDGMDHVNYAPGSLFPMPNQMVLPEMLPDARYEENPAQAPRAAEAANLPVRSQPARALDPQDGSLTSQFFGPSGETDPYLLRHMRFSEEGSCNFGQFQYRSLYQGTTRTELSPSDNNNAFPVHFMISAPRNPFSKDGSEEPEEHTQREDLDRLVDPELGARLVGLFLRYVFPSLPVLSRSTLNVRTETLIPKAKALDNLPSYLLAAVYASADMFRRYDPTLNVSRTDAEIHTTALWRMAHRGIMRQMHMPRLAVIQALLIYLQRPMEDTITATTDSPGQWPLLGSVVQLASQIGLHLDCQLWPIPEWEKRLRRRLWWVVYSEAIWRSLLLGLPQPIQAGQWEVTPLGEKDFLIDHLQCPTEETATQTPALQKPCGFCHAGHDFRFLADLTLISYDVYQSFYTLSATKGLSNDFEGSLNLGRIYLDRLNKWGAQLPKQMALDAVSNTETRDYFHSGSASHLKLAFFTLKAMVYRAIIRPLANAGPPESMAPTSTHLDENTNQCSPTANSSITATLGLESSAIIQDALNLSRQASQWAQRLGSYDRNSFSRSWSRACFATISNLIMLLLLLAPTAASAKEVLAVLARWVIILREQSIVFNNMQLGLLRLDAIFRLGLAKAFRFSTHVADSVHRELPTPSYQR